MYLNSSYLLDGHENDPLVLVSGTMEEELCMPGTTTMNTVTRMRLYFLFSFQKVLSLDRNIESSCK